MHCFAFRQLALLLVAALCPALAFAASATYEGQLISRTSETPIAIVLQMEEFGGFLTGKIKTSYPFKGTATIDSGRNVAGYCNLTSALSGSVTLRLYGNCSGTVFEGSYTLYYTQSKNAARGTFRLTKQTSDSGKAGSGLTDAEVAASSVVACVKTNTRCLASCPRGDTDAEYLCANHCRTKMNTCKAKAHKLDTGLESP